MQFGLRRPSSIHSSLAPMHISCQLRFQPRNSCIRFFQPCKVLLQRQFYTLLFPLSCAKVSSKPVAAMQFLGHKTNPLHIIQSFQSGLLVLARYYNCSKYPEKEPPPIIGEASPLSENSRHHPCKSSACIIQMGRLLHVFSSTKL